MASKHANEDWRVVQAMESEKPPGADHPDRASYVQVDCSRATANSSITGPNMRRAFAARRRT
jgi:hypothetical protein